MENEGLFLTLIHTLNGNWKYMENVAYGNVNRESSLCTISTFNHKGLGERWKHRL